MKTINQEKKNQTSPIKPHLSNKNKSTKNTKHKQKTSASNSTSRRHLKKNNLCDRRSSESSLSDSNAALSNRRAKRKRQRSSSSHSQETSRSSTTSNSEINKRPRLDAGVLEDFVNGEQRKSGARFSERKFTGEKPYMCNHCPLTFSSLDNRVVHERTHKEKPFECLYCEMRFAFQLSLNRHMKIHQ